MLDGLGEHGGGIDHVCYQVTNGFLDKAQELMKELGYAEIEGRRIESDEGWTSLFYVRGVQLIQLFYEEGVIICDFEEVHLAIQATDPLKAAVAAAILAGVDPDEDGRIVNWGTNKWAVDVGFLSCWIEFVPLPLSSFEMPVKAAETTDEMWKFMQRVGAFGTKDQMDSGS